MDKLALNCVSSSSSRLMGLHRPASAMRSTQGKGSKHNGFFLNFIHRLNVSKLAEDLQSRVLGMEHLHAAQMPADSIDNLS